MEGPEAVRQLVHTLATSEVVDKVGKPLATKVADVVGHGTLKDVLSGVWLAHPLHPMLTDLPIGFGPARSCSTWWGASVGPRRRNA